MRPHPLAKRYAKAVFELAADAEQVEKVLDEVISFGKTLKENSRLRAYLFSPEVDKNLKIAAVDTLVKDKVTGLFYNFLKLLIKKGRQRLYHEIVFEFSRLSDVKKNRLRGKVTSAVPLDKKHLALIQQRLSESFNAKIILETEIDADIIGGLILYVEGKVINGSVRHQLEQLHKHLRIVKFE